MLLEQHARPAGGEAQRAPRGIEQLRRVDADQRVGAEDLFGGARGVVGVELGVAAVVRSGRRREAVGGRQLEGFGAGPVSGTVPVPERAAAVPAGRRVLERPVAEPPVFEPPVSEPSAGACGFALTRGARRFAAEDFFFGRPRDFLSSSALVSM